MPCNKVSLLNNLVILQKETISDLGQFRLLFKETNSKNWEFCVKKERERKKTNKIAKVIKCNMGTKKHD